MVGVNHVTTGVLVATVINKPAFALPLALLSHFAIDALPHWNYQVSNKLEYRQIAMMIDLTFSLFILLVFSVSLDASTRLIIGCGFLALLPDAMWLPHILQGKKAPIGKNNLLHFLRRIHTKAQWSESSNGAYFEAAWFILTVYLIIHFGTG